MKRPHIAFEQDLIANFIASSHTAEIKTKEEKLELEEDLDEDLRAWIDSSSSGAGELETNDADYTYNYLSIPQNINSINENIDMIKEKLSGYSLHSDPLITHNN